MRLPLILVSTLFAGAVLAAETPKPVAEPAAAPSNVRVTYTKPEAFADATYDNRAGSRKDVTRDLTKVFAELGKRYLPPNQRLDIEVTDIDLAGRYEPWQTQNPDIRYLRDVTWPRISLKYRLFDGDREIGHGEDKLSDMSYLTRPGFSKSGDRLKYEKAMLEDWFRGRFAAAAR